MLRLRNICISDLSARTLKSLALIPLILSMGTACTPGPDYERPQTHAEISDEFVNTPDAGNTQNETMSHWWRHIGDPDIHQDISLLFAQNLDLKEADARINQAREQVKINAGLFAPMVSFNTSGTRRFLPAEEFGVIFGGGGGGGSSEVARVFDTQLQGSLNVSWQLDVFGQIRTQVNASKARFEATELDREALIHSLIAELVRRRVALTSLLEQLSVANEMVENRKRVLTLVQQRYERGANGVSASDVHLARQLLASIQADIPDIEQAIKENVYALDVLLGQAPGTTKPHLENAVLEPPPLSAPIGVPARLLDRRPDLRAAELRVIAENSDVGIAVADLYPSLLISSQIGFEDESINGLINSERMIGSLVGQMTTRLFEGGALRARIRFEKAQQEELAATYSRAVLTAMQEVEISLIQETKIDNRIGFITTQVNASDNRRLNDKSRYERGLITLNQYLDSELDYYTARMNKIVAQEAKWNARINLYLALGGDWIDPAPFTKPLHRFATTQPTKQKIVDSKEDSG